MVSLKTPLAIYPRQSLLIVLARWTSSMKKLLDYSKYPALNENDLEEQIIRGTGPASKTNNCVLLKHLPTGIVIRCYENRETHKNQQLARERLLEKLDDHLNGDQSISAQMARMEKEKERIRQAKAAELREKKRKFKEKIDSSSKNTSDHSDSR